MYGGARPAQIYNEGRLSLALVSSTMRAFPSRAAKCNGVNGLGEDLRPHSPRKLRPQEIARVVPRISEKGGVLSHVLCTTRILFGAPAMSKQGPLLCSSRSPVVTIWTRILAGPAGRDLPLDSFEW